MGAGDGTFISGQGTGMDTAPQENHENAKRENTHAAESNGRLGLAQSEKRERWRDLADGKEGASQSLRLSG